MNISLDQRANILELTARFALYVDLHQTAEVVSLFTEDGEMDETLLGIELAKGTEQLTNHFEAGRVRVAHMAHYVTNHILDVNDQGDVIGTCFVLADAIFKSGERISVKAFYDDSYEHVGDKWRFRSRKVNPLLPVDISSIW